MASFTETYIDPIFLTEGTPVNKTLTGEHCKLLPPVEKYVMAEKCISIEKQNVTTCGLPVYQDLNMCHDWTVQKAITDMQSGCREILHALLAIC